MERSPGEQTEWQLLSWFHLKDSVRKCHLTELIFGVFSWISTIHLFRCETAFTFTTLCKRAFTISLIHNSEICCLFSCKCLGQFSLNGATAFTSWWINSQLWNWGNSEERQKHHLQSVFILDKLRWTHLKMVSTPLVLLLKWFNLT